MLVAVDVVGEVRADRFADAAEQRREYVIAGEVDYLTVRADVAVETVYAPAVIVLGCGIVGAGLGALVGLLVVTLLNENCDGFLEQAAGCSRYDVGAVTAIGAGLGFVAGLVLGAIIVGARAGRELRRR